MRTVAIVQARTKSSRLYSKVTKDLGGITAIAMVLERLKQSHLVSTIVLATSEDPSDDALCQIAQDLQVGVFRGSEKDVLSRYYGAALQFQADIVVRITGDCPFVDPEIVDSAISLFMESKIDYLSNVAPPTFPDGLDIEIFSSKALQIANLEAKSKQDREHVTKFIRESKDFRTKNFSNTEDYSFLRVTLDTEEDLEVIRSIVRKLGEPKSIRFKQIIDLYKVNPRIFEANNVEGRNLGALMTESQKLWNRAKKIIPGGNMLLSKRQEMFAPEIWPTYYSRSLGCEVWDLEGNRFIDMSTMSVGTNSLGYGYASVDAAAKAAITNGNMSTLNCPEEVYLAEKLLEINPWAKMVKLARTGGEANAIAIRIARAFSGKDKVAVCGYHGWHDWYLAANLGEDTSLDGHLLPGLEPKGVPRGLAGSTLTFHHNDILGLRELVSRGDIGVIKMEVQRSTPPDPEFLSEVRKIATDHGIVLIFDECTSGFRETFGGIYSKFNVTPDIAVYGKALGNGYAITAVVGVKDVMQSAQSTFISSTFWTERIGPSAALATLTAMEENKSWEYISMIGNQVREGWLQLAERHQLKIQTFGLKSLPGFTISSPHANLYKTFITQEMLKRGFLAANTFYASLAHTEKIVSNYLFELDAVFGKIASYETDPGSFELIIGQEAHQGFRRLN